MLSTRALGIGSIDVEDIAAHVEQEEFRAMMNELRGAVVLLVTLIVFVIIIAVLALGTVMRPGRWSERPRFIG
jgi:hypothetical protein